MYTHLVDIRVSGLGGRSGVILDVVFITAQPIRVVVDSDSARQGIVDQDTAQAGDFGADLADIAIRYGRGPSHLMAEPPFADLFARRPARSLGK